ncbi:ATP-binding cassette domain-containing protein [Paenarthrobacter sp. Z7-10]|uniref:ATP-binding cassette domain-containing protein n=1 Tax=Paenarthrobacter sp. Z7-10 TaxID=2787635 RepID=UPI0022A9D9C3|nr:ATP-binding cassette domain-containing protein [Paenarthrobacter sp. Z7-10]MCZ2402277.1 ATP-binding cassette domain-containing protein [Paenarthrobacter sp. Z7-10]
MIRIRGLSKSFGAFKALDGLDLDVPEGQVLGLLGPNGAGKTTTVRVLTTLLQPDAGEATVAGHSVLDDPDGVRRSIGLSGQYAAVDEKLTGYENLYMVGRLYGMSRKASAGRASELLDQFRLSEVAGKRAGAYSGGMRRRLDLAGAIVARPPVVVLDEPTTGLDPRGRLDTWEVISSLVSSGTTVLLTTQYLEEADQLADNIAVIDAGRVIAKGTADELKAQVGSERIDVVLANPDHMQAAAALVSSTAGPGARLEINHQTRRISAAAPEGHRMLVRTLTDLQEAGLPVVEASLRRPTLDDVFLQLTGERPDEPAPAPSDPHEPSRKEAINA